MENIISEHLFVFPFSWKCHKRNNDDLFHQHTQIKGRNFEQLGHWKEHTSTIDSDKDYNEYVYFYKPIRMALYTFDHAATIVRNYYYEALDTSSFFEIIQGDETYHLGIKQIDLKLYKTGIGMLSFRFVNRDYEGLEALERINSFSQCVYPPILPLEKARAIGLPSKIRIQLNNQLMIEEDFEQIAKARTLAITPIIMNVLGEPFQWQSSALLNGQIWIEPILGNQMFCSCMYYNEEMVNDLYEGKMELAQLEGLMHAYKQSDYLEEDQKVGEGSYLKGRRHLYGINRFMLLCITKEPLHDRLYDQLVKLVLMQRATLLNLSAELARISTLQKTDLPSAIASIYEIYIQFINQLYFKEVTEDPEGSYIYEQLSTAFKIGEELEQLNFEIDEVHEYANLVDQSSSNFKVQLLTIIGAALVLPSFMTGFFGMNIFQKEALHWWNNRAVGLWLNTYVLLPILAVIALCLWNKRRTAWSLLIKVVLIIVLLVSISFTLRFGCGL